MKGMAWKKNLEEASGEIRGGTRLPILFFFGKNCEGSKKTEAEVLKNEDVLALIEREGVALRYVVEDNAGVAGEYRVDWTPTVIVADEDGRELERWVGYLPAQEFRAQLILSKGLSAFHLNRLEEAASLFEELVEEFPASDLVPEAEYFLVAITHKTDAPNKIEKIVRICRRITREHPESIWAKKCSIWAHLPVKGQFVGYDSGGMTGEGAY